MKIVYQDLISFLEEKPSKEDLSEKLFQLGHEHEVHGDIFDMELTPNRGDCLSLLGLARDLNVFFKMNQPIAIYDGEIETLNLDFKNLSTESCPQISFLEIQIEGKTRTYKPYLENYFSKLGNKKTNFFTDVSNYISYEQGQPTHCFDRNAVTKTLVFENRVCDESFNTLLGTKIKLEGNNCVFSIDNEVISLAGVMGGDSSACSNNTKKALVECAYFNPEAIIGKSIKYNLASDAAHKFERGVDITSQERVLRRFIRIVQEHSSIKNISIKSFISTDFKHSIIKKDFNKINKILGMELQEIKYLSYLKNLGFSVNERIKVPAYRHDIESQNDLAEEIARVIGYNNIPAKPINLNKSKRPIGKNKIAIIESFLIKNGFSEVINYPFSSKKEKDSISIDNPLDSNRANFRTCIKESLIENLLYNERRQQDSIKLFEISDIYTKDPKINKQKRLCILVSGRQGHNYINFSKKLNNDYLNNLLNDNLSNPCFSISEISRNELNTKKKDKIFYIEINLDNISEEFYSNNVPQNHSINFVQYQPISEFPSSSRDFSFSITNLSKVNEVISCFHQISDKDLRNSFMFDFYKNDKTDSVKIGFRLSFQSLSKTLSDEEIDEKIEAIISPIIKLDGVSIPGYQSGL